jgi:hypothetical protein
VSEYPHNWRRDDLDAAGRVLGVPTHEGRLVGTVHDYPLQLSERHNGIRHHVEAVFTVPPQWPLFTLLRDRGEQRPSSSGEITEDWTRLPDVGGCQLWTPDTGRTLQLFERGGLAALVARHPLERLRIGAPASFLTSCAGARLNADTAQWVADLVAALLTGAPAYAELGLIDMAPGIAWTPEHLDRNLGITPPGATG